MKSATSSLHNYLSLHPRISVSTPKELNFFVEPRYSELGMEWYRSQFSTPADALVAGESSVNYTKRKQFPGVAARMHSHIPDARLVYVLRDPLKRIESHWVHLVGSGKWRDDFASAISDPESSHLIDASCYWAQLSEYLKYYDPSQIKLISYEDLARDPGAVVSDTLEFIGLDRDFEHPSIGEKIHQSSRKVRPNRLGLLVWDDKVLQRRLRRRVPWLVGRPIAKPVWDEAVRARVVDYLRPDIEKLREFAGRDFEEWSI